MYLFLLILFMIHLCVTIKLYLRKKRFEYGLLILVFGLLTISVLFRLCLPEVKVFDIRFVNILRVVACSLSFISISLMIKNYIKRDR